MSIEQITYINNNGKRVTGFGIQAGKDNLKELTSFATQHSPCNTHEMSETYLFAMGVGYNIRRYVIEGTDNVETEGKLRNNSILLHGEWLVCDTYGMEIIPPFNIIEYEAKQASPAPAENFPPDFKKASGNYLKWFGEVIPNNTAWDKFDKPDVNNHIYFNTAKFKSQVKGLIERTDYWDNIFSGDDWKDVNSYWENVADDEFEDPFNDLDVFQMPLNASEVDVIFFRDFVKESFDEVKKSFDIQASWKYRSHTDVATLNMVTVKSPAGQFVIVRPGDYVISFRGSLFVHEPKEQG